MSEAKFILSKKKLLEQVKILNELEVKISYSYKTNRDVGNLLQEESKVDFSVHAKEEIYMIKDKTKIWFFSQAKLDEELEELLNEGVRNFVIDNEVDLGRLMQVITRKRVNISLSLRMKFQEHRIGTGKYFVYGMDSRKINELLKSLRNNEFIEKLGVHIHRKSQNTSEWEIVTELKDSLGENLKLLNFVNLGGGLPVEYRSYTSKVMPYIFSKIKNAKKFLGDLGVETYIEPGRFIAAPCINLIVEIIQIQEKNIIVNTTIYNCALDTILTGTKLLVEGENEQGDFYLIKGNSPTRDDIFRYKVGIKNPRVGDKIIFLNAGAYNYTTDFFGYKKLETKIVEDFN